MVGRVSNPSPALSQHATDWKSVLRHSTKVFRELFWTCRGAAYLMSAMNQPASLMRRGFDLFLISFVVLYLELAAIRWFPAYVLSLTFFTNFVLLAAFVGMSVGCLAANHRWRVFDHLPSLIAVTLGAALGFHASL